MASPQAFFDAMMEKFQLKLRENKLRYSPEPWSDHPESFLWSRLFAEIQELEEAIEYDRLNHRWRTEITDEAADELLDVANFCMFLWIRHQIQKD